MSAGPAGRTMKMCIIQNQINWKSYSIYIYIYIYIYTHTYKFFSMIKIKLPISFSMNHLSGWKIKLYLNDAEITDKDFQYKITFSKSNYIFYNKSMTALKCHPETTSKCINFY